jgi:dipeptidyl aminopeptidase/acylaminoacyl peptidase
MPRVCRRIVDGNIGLRRVVLFDKAADAIDFAVEADRTDMIQAAWHGRAPAPCVRGRIVFFVEWLVNEPRACWLLLPLHASGKIPMVTVVHGGPAAASRPSFSGPSLRTALIQRGWAVFYPNPRGSFGQGERFTAANIRDFGYGDLRDGLTGIDAAELAAPIDERRLGLIGGSYGGYMTMWAVTQTNRFKAAVAAAGVSNMLSYYGENGIDAWMLPYFGASVYDDPAVYARSSPITFIKNVHTPTFAYVGERDIE